MSVVSFQRVVLVKSLIYFLMCKLCTSPAYGVSVAFVDFYGSSAIPIDLIPDTGL